MRGYMTGFGNHFASEAVAGALPVGRNSPQQVPFGLYAEQMSGTAFTAPRADNRRTWFYRLHPSAQHAPFTPWDGAPHWPGTAAAPTPNRLRWSPLPLTGNGDFVEGMLTYAASCDVAINLYATTRSMTGRAAFNADAEMVIVPQHGALRIITECGVMDVEPLSIAVIPRGMKFRVEVSGPSRGYVCENLGAPFRLPELGPIGSNGLANARDFETPMAAFEDTDEPCELLQKYCGTWWRTQLQHSPFDAVAWHGNHVPYRYDLRRFNTINTVSFDHPDPSVFTVLSAPSDVPGTANCDFVIFPPRWTVAEDTFRPPWFHRNIMSEFMGLIHGTYDAKADGFAPGGASLHTSLSAHGPDCASYEAGIAADLKPHRISDTMAFMFEGRHVLHPTVLAQQMAQADYDRCWDGFAKANLP